MRNDFKNWMFSVLGSVPNAQKFNAFDAESTVGHHIVRECRNHPLTRSSLYSDSATFRQPAKSLNGIVDSAAHSISGRKVTI